MVKRTQLRTLGTIGLIYCLIIFSASLNTVFRKAENITKQYIKVESDLKQFCELIHLKGPHPRQRSSIATAISNGNLDQISRVWAPATATTTMTCRSLLRLLLIRIFWYLVGDLVIRGEVRHCYYQRTEKDWTDRSLRVWVDHQQQPQQRSDCTSRLRLKSLSWMGPLKRYGRNVERHRFPRK